MRLFIAVNLSAEIKQSLIKTMHDLKQAGIKGSFVPADNLHMTLCFIGETKQKQEIIDCMKAIKFEPFRLSITETGAFGDLLWIGAKGNQKMKALVKDLRAELDMAGISYDKKEFKPHITMIRRMNGKLPKDFTVPKAEMMVKNISLMKSEQKNGRRVYTEIFRLS